MGMTYADVTLTGPTGEMKLRLLVDTGSLLTWVSRDSLQAIGVKPSGKRKFKTIEGRELIRETSEAVLEIMGERATRLVVLGEAGDAEVLGSDALEGLGLEVDPATKSLRKTEVFVAYMATRQASSAVECYPLSNATAGMRLYLKSSPTSVLTPSNWSQTKDRAGRDHQNNLTWPILGA